MADNIKYTEYAPSIGIISGRCTVTNTSYSVMVFPEAYQAWKNGELVQKAFPKLTVDEREFIVSGTTPAEWRILFDGLDE
jgi:hypothetical protein